MATTFYLTNAAGDVSPGPATGKSASTSRGSGVQSNVLTPTNGPTAGQQIGDTLLEWFTFPVAGVTISGTVTFNIWGSESSTSLNAGYQVQIDEVNAAGSSVVHAIVNSERGTEMAGTTSAVNNWTASPTSTTVTAGNRLRIRVLVNDAGGTLNQSGPRTVTTRFSGTSGGADGDTFVTFTESITASGTAYTKSLAGTMGSLSGTLAKKVKKPLAGAPASLTGTVTKKTSRHLAGAPASLTGTVAKKTKIPLAGTCGALSGTIARKTGKALAGSITGSGTVAKKTSRALAGTCGNLTGALAKKTKKALAGTAGALAGALSSIQSSGPAMYFVSLAGSVGPLTGSLSRKTQKSLAGSITGSGTLAKKTARHLAGTCGSLSGTLRKKTRKSLSGAFTATGSLVTALSTPARWARRSAHFVWSSFTAKSSWSRRNSTSSRARK